MSSQADQPPSTPDQQAPGSVPLREVVMSLPHNPDTMEALNDLAEYEASERALQVRLERMREDDRVNAAITLSASALSQTLTETNKNLAENNAALRHANVHNAEKFAEYQAIEQKVNENRKKYLASSAKATASAKKLQHAALDRTADQVPKNLTNQFENSTAASCPATAVPGALRRALNATTSLIPTFRGGASYEPSVGVELSNAADAKPAATNSASFVNPHAGTVNLYPIASASRDSTPSGNNKIRRVKTDRTANGSDDAASPAKYPYVKIENDYYEVVSETRCFFKYKVPGEDKERQVSKKKAQVEHLAPAQANAGMASRKSGRQSNTVDGIPPSKKPKSSLTFDDKGFVVKVVSDSSDEAEVFALVTEANPTCTIGKHDDNTISLPHRVSLDDHHVRLNFLKRTGTNAALQVCNISNQIVLINKQPLNVFLDVKNRFAFSGDTIFLRQRINGQALTEGPATVLQVSAWDG